MGISPQTSTTPRQLSKQALFPNPNKYIDAGILADDHTVVNQQCNLVIRETRCLGDFEWPLVAYPVRY